MNIRHPHVRRPGAAVFLSYLALSVVAHLNAWRGGPAHKIQMGGGDLPTYLWGLRWVPYALSNGQNPFFTDFSNYPAGVNLLNNTNSFLLAVVAAPITVIWGSIATYNVLQTLAFACSAFAAYVLLRRWTSWRPAAYVGGLLYGFSPFMVAAGWAHLFLIFAPVPPLIILCLDELIVRQRGSNVRWGLCLGLLVVVQFFISSEMLANTVELCVAGVVVLALLCRDQVRPRFAYAARGVLAGAALAAVLLAYPAWFTLFGPQHVRIEIPAEIVSSDLLAPIVPNSNHVLTPSAVRELGDSFSGPIPFMGRTYVIAGVGYLGIPLLLLLGWIVVRYRRLVAVRLFAIMTFVAFVASLGPRLKIGAELTDIRMPAWILTKLPVLDATVTYRYALFVPLGAAVVLAIGLDRMREELAARPQTRASRYVLPALTAIVMVPLLPSFPYSVMDVPTPRYFSSGAATEVPAGSVLVSYPFPGPLAAETMAWQARNDFHYRIVGGYQNLPDGRGGFSHEGNLSVTKDVLNGFLRGDPPTITADVRSSMLADLVAWDAETIAIDLGAPGASDVVSLYSQLLGRDPEHTEGVALWRSVGGTTEGGP